MKKLKRIMATAMAITALAISCLSPVEASAATSTKQSVQPQATAAISNSKMKKNVKFTFKKTPTGLIAYVKKKNKFNVQVYSYVNFKNSKNKQICKSQDNTYCLEKGKTAVFEYYCINSNYKYTKFKKYSHTYNVYVADGKASYVSKISAKLTKKTNSYCTVTFKNNSKQKLSFIHYTVLFTDKKGNIINVYSSYANCTKKNSKDTRTIYYDYSSKTHSYVKPAKYKIIIDYAYRFTR